MKCSKMLVDFQKIGPRIHSKGVNIECLHVQLVQSLDIASIKMSYSSAAQLEVSSASVKHFMKRCTQEWAHRLKVVPAMRLLVCTCSSWHWAQRHAVCERTWTNALLSCVLLSVSHLWHILVIAND